MGTCLRQGCLLQWSGIIKWYYMTYVSSKVWKIHILNISLLWEISFSPTSKVSYFSHPKVFCFDSDLPSWYIFNYPLIAIHLKDAWVCIITSFLPVLLPPNWILVSTCTHTTLTQCGSRFSAHSSFFTIVGFLSLGDRINCSLLENIHFPWIPWKLLPGFFPYLSVYLL